MFAPSDIAYTRGTQNGNNDFFSVIRTITGSVNNVVNAVEPIWNQNSNTPNSGQILSQPTFLGQPTVATTGTAITTQPKDYTPLLIIGGIVLVAVLALK